MNESTTKAVAPLPLLGTRRDQFEALVGGVLALAVTVGYVLVARAFDTPTTKLEFFALIANLACVWLARTQNIWAMPYGIAAVVLLGVFFFSVDLVGQAWLQYLYYVPVQLLGWWTWARGGTGRTELEVGSLGAKGWALTLLGGAALWVGCWALFTSIYDAPSYVLWDTSIVSASVVAQTLMTWKRREHCIFWIIPVNISSMLLYLRTEAWAFLFLYGVFFCNAVWGWLNWRPEGTSDE